MAEPMRDLTVWLTSSAWSPSGWLVRVAVVVALFASFWTPAHAQTIEGHLLDGSTQLPIPGGVITLVAEAGEALERVEADSAGYFSITAATAGSYYLRAERIGYRTRTEGVFDLGRDGKLEIEFYILPEAIELEGIKVQVDRTRIDRRLVNEGFFERSELGMGDFFPPEVLERQQVAHFSDFVTRLPRVAVHRDGLLKFTVGGGDCEPNVWIDGILVLPGLASRPEMRRIDSIISPDNVAAIEVYRSVSALPMRWGGFNGSCGSIVIWTKSE